MTLAIKLSPAEQVRRAREADPTLTDDQLRERFGVTAGQLKAAFAYGRPTKKRGGGRPS